MKIHHSSCDFDSFWKRTLPVFEEIFLHTGAFTNLDFEGIFEGQVGDALALLNEHERNDYKEFELKFQLARLCSEPKATVGEIEELTNRRDKISRAYGKDVFRRANLDIRFKHWDEKIDWISSKNKINEAFYASDSTFKHWRPFDTFKNLFGSRAIFFDAKISNDFKIVVGFDPTKQSIDEFSWIFCGEDWETGVNFRTLFCLPLLQGTMTRGAELDQWLTRYCHGLVTFVLEARKVFAS